MRTTLSITPAAIKLDMKPSGRDGLVSNLEYMDGSNIQQSETTAFIKLVNES